MKVLELTEGLRHGEDRETWVGCHCICSLFIDKKCLGHSAYTEEKFLFVCFIISEVLLDGLLALLPLGLWGGSIE